MTTTETGEILGLFDRWDEESKKLIFEAVNGLARCRLTCEEIESATGRIMAGGDKIETLESLVQLSNERIFDCEVIHG